MTNNHAKKFHCNACATISDFELLDEELITKIEHEHVCPRCHASGKMQLLFEINCVRCSTLNLVNEEVYADGAGALSFKCEPCLIEEERIRREEEERKRREEEERKRREEEERLRREEEDRIKREEEARIQAEQERLQEEKEKLEAQARAEEELRLAKEQESAQAQFASEQVVVSAPEDKVEPLEEEPKMTEEYLHFKNKKNKNKKSNKSETREYLEAFFTALLIALFLRAFVVEAFKIPSKSMVPNLLVGDHLFVNKFVYGLRLPLSKKWIAHFGTPQRGEVVVFSWPKDESMDFIKRVVGLPGDTIKVDRRDVYVNGQKMSLYPAQVDGVDPTNKEKLKLSSIAGPVQEDKFKQLPYMLEWKEFDYYVEDLAGVKHFTQYMKPLWSPPAAREWVVPPGHLFVMGDNRDNSSDSREWGFVPMENLRGRAMFVWFSWDSETLSSPWYSIQDWPKRIRWSRFGKAIE